MREIHPLADDDGILRDGECRSLYFKCMCDGGRDNPQIVMATLFDLFNAHMFDGALPTPTLRVVPDFEVSGRLEWEPHPMVMSIHQTILMDSYEWARDVMVHEMCHLHVRAIQGDRTHVSHGPAWVAVAERLGVCTSDE